MSKNVGKKTQAQTKAQKRKARQRKRRKRVLLLVAELLILLVLIGVVYATQLVGKIDFETMTAEEAGINQDLDEVAVETMEKYTNIVLLGLDNRESGKYDSGLSDSIMVARIDNETKEIQLISVYRDTCMDVGSGKLAKVNSAFSRGGAVNSVQTLNKNLDLNIDNYVCVDWLAVVETIDALGGLDLELTAPELDPMNFYIPEIDQMTGLSTALVTTDGMQHLDGTQCVAYMRVRYTAGDDFKRASRQRIVLQAMMNKAKQASPATLLKICNEVFDDISTSLSLSKILSLAKDVKAYNIVETTGFPFRLSTAQLKGSGDTVIPAELSNNVSTLHEFMFGQSDYEPSQTVKAISNNIVSTTGITRDSAIIDTSSYNDTLGHTGTGGL